MRKYYLLFLILSVYSSLYSQNNLKLIDSLKDQLKKGVDPKTEAKIYGDLTWYYATITTDSALVYGKQAIDAATRLKDTSLLAQSLSDNGVVYYLRGNFERSKVYFSKSLALRQKTADTLGIAALHSKLGNVYYKQGIYDSTMRSYIQALKIYENKGDVATAATVRSNLAALYTDLKDYDKALQHLDECIDFFKQTGQDVQRANTIINKASVYLYQGDTLLANKTLLQSIALTQPLNAAITLGPAYNNLASNYRALGEYKKAKDAITKSISYRTQSGMLTDLESSKLTLAEIETVLGNYKIAKPLYYQALTVFNTEGYVDKLPQIYLGLLEVYAAEANPDSIEFYAKKFIDTQNLVAQKQIQDITAELDTKYQTEKKEKEILAQRAQLAQKELEVERKNLLLYGGGGFLLLIAILGYLLYNQQKLKNSQLLKEQELHIALAKIETQNRLQEQRLRISRDLHDNIGSQLTFIISSIDNLKYALRDAGGQVSNKLTEISHFTTTTINELRDTIWAMNKESITFDDLQGRISNFIEKAQRSQEHVDFDFKLDTSVPKAYQFTSIEGVNIYRIIQEAVNNALKYADAQTILITIAKMSEGLQIKIADNGQGFDTENFIPGNGINNMRKRAQEINAELQVDSYLNTGTSVVLKTPLAAA